MFRIKLNGEGLYEVYFMQLSGYERGVARYLRRRDAINLRNVLNRAARAYYSEGV